MSEILQLRPGDWRTIPNLVTLLRLLLILPICGFIISGGQPVLTLVLAAIFGTTDWVDGFLARRLNQTSRFGQILDPIADRIGVALILVALTIAGLLPWWIAVLTLLMDLAVTVSLFFAKDPGSLSVSIIGKVRTAVLMVGLVLVLIARVPQWQALAEPAVLLTGLGAVLHALAGLGYIYRLLARAPRGEAG